MKLRIDLKKDQRIFFTSDLHYAHTNIVRAISKWNDTSGCRDFSSVEEMNDLIIDNINEVVKKTDILFILGDLSFGDPANIYICRKRINCTTIHYILGNHDKNIEENRALKTDDGIKYPKNLFTSINDVVHLKVGKTSLFLSHYSHRVWDKSHRGKIMLYGHSHGSIPDLGKSMDVGVDTNNFMPYSLDDIVQIMDKKEIHFTDHHNSDTN